MATQTPINDLRRFLFVQFSNNETQLTCLTAKQLRSRTRSSSTIYRVSPIWPAVPDEAKLPPANIQDYFVGFFFFEDPSLAIGKLIAKIPKSSHKNLWFSCGLASVLLITSERQEFDAVLAADPDKLRGIEVWRVSKGRIVTEKPELKAPAKINSSICSIADCVALDSETQIVVNELRHCLNTAVARAALFLPSSLKTFERLFPAINDVITELVKLQANGAETSKLICASAGGDYAEPRLALQKRKQQLTDQLVQVNSALSYVNSQAYAGIAPILQHECQIRKYSLLGIGSAHNGIAAFTEFCELTFQRYPVDTVVKQEFKKAPGFSFEYTGSETPADWDDIRFNVDHYIADVTPQESKLNLAYFSGRLGFRETQFTVTAPLQALSHAGTARWSLMTLTHELMHAHVRALLAAVFSSIQGNDPVAAFESLYKEFCNRSSEEKKPTSLLETIQFVLFNYCDMKPGVDAGAAKLASGASSTITFDVKRVDTSRFTTRLQAYYREINEILVHVLDFNYFYDCREGPYLMLLWSSWAPVSTVLDNVEEYLLRSVLAISCRLSGNSEARFSQAAGKVEKVLQGLEKRHPSDPLFTLALKRLANSTVRKQLLAKFCLSIYLVDMAQKALVCKHIHAALYTDQNRLKHDLKYSYALETGSFEPITIASPVAFVSDLLRRELEGETTTLSEDYVSAWLYLVCASAPIERPNYVS